MGIKEILKMLDEAETEDQLETIINQLTIIEQIAIIRKYLKTLSKGFRVRNERGTGSGYCIISGSAENKGFTEQQTQILENLGLNARSNTEIISPNQLDYWCLKSFKHL